MAKSHYQEVQETMDEFEQPQEAIVVTANTGNIKDSLPMLYTARGKLIKNPNKHRISGLNAAAMLNRVNAIQHGENKIVLIMPSYHVIMSYELSAQLRNANLIAEIILGGYDLS